MRKNEKGFGIVEILLIIVVIGLLVAVGWLFFDRQSNQKKEDSKAPETSSQKPEIKTPEQKDPYEGWQTYSNTEAGFTVKYPADWQFNAKGSKDKSGEGEFGGNQFVSKANYDAGNNASILQLDTGITTSTAEQFAKDYYVNKVSPVVSSTGSKINGYSAQTVNFKSPDGNPSGYNVFVVNNGKVAQFTYYTGDEYMDTYKAIIDSVKFN